MWLDGINSSRLIATGDMVNAYLVNGLTTCKRTNNKLDQRKRTDRTGKRYFCKS
jgi:hypothetical protein